MGMLLRRHYERNGGEAPRPALMVAPKAKKTTAKKTAKKK